MAGLRTLVPHVEFAGVGGAAMEDEGIVSLFPDGAAVRHGSGRGGSAPVRPLHPARPNGGGGAGLLARRARHHRQSGFRAASRREGPPRCASDADDPLRRAVRLGLAARTGRSDGPGDRSRPGPPPVRAAVHRGGGDDVRLRRSSGGRRAAGDRDAVRAFRRVHGDRIALALPGSRRARSTASRRSSGRRCAPRRATSASSSPRCRTWPTWSVTQCEDGLAAPSS